MNRPPFPTDSREWAPVIEEIFDRLYAIENMSIVIKTKEGTLTGRPDLSAGRSNLDLNQGSEIGN